MTGCELQAARRKAGWTQQQAAPRLGVTQSYLSMLERGLRPLTPKMATRLGQELPLAPEQLSLSTKPFDEEHLHKALGGLGYPGFAYLRTASAVNPATLLLGALDRDELDARLVDALPWVPLAYPQLDWDWLLPQVKMRDRQNRLGFVLTLARQAAERSANGEADRVLARQLERLERSRLAADDTLCHDSMSANMRRWMRQNRSKAARHWNILSNLVVEHLPHACA